VKSRFFLLSFTFQTHFVQITKPSLVLVRPTGIQALPSPVNSIIMKIGGHLIWQFDKERRLANI